jgi:cytochrome P450
MRPLPFVDRIRPGVRELIAERVFDLDRDGYLRMHQVYGYPTLPGTFVPELAAEAALALVRGRVPVAFEDLRLESFLRVYKADRPQAKRIQARLVSGDEVESVVAVRVLGDLIAPNGMVLATDRLHFSVTVRMRDAPVPAPAWTHWDDDGAEPLADPYHADGSPVLLQGVFRSTRDTRLHPLGRRAALDLDATAVRRWFPDLVLPSLLLDGLVRVAVLERQEGRWTPVAIPRYVRRIDLYQSHTDASLAASGEAVELYVTPVDIDLESRQPDNRALAVRANGEVILQIKDTVGAIVGYLDQLTGRFVDRSSFDRGVRLPGRRLQRRPMTAKHVPVVSAPPQPAPAAGCPVSGVATGRCPVAHGPKGLPVIGDAPAYFRDPAAYTLLLAETRGPMVRVCLPKPFVQVTDPAAIEQVLRVNPDNYTRGVLYKGFAGFMGRGLLTLDDRQWRDHRKVVQPAFTPQRLGADAQEAVPATAAVLQRWQQAARRTEPIDIAPDVMSIATRTVGRAILGRDLSEPALGYAHAAGFATRAMYTATIMGLNELVPDTVPTRYNRTKRRSQRVLDQVIGEVITARRRSGDLGQDAAGLLLASDLDDQAVADNLRTLLLAGTDTTGQALAWTLYELARHPRARQEVEEEVDRVLGGEAPSAQTRDQLPVTGSAVEEALRLHPPVWQFPRDSIQDEVVAGRDIPGGSTLLLSTYGTHRSAQLWTDPEAYEPARFRDGSAQTRPRHAFFPFGGGRRLCIGRNLAMATLVTAIAMISQRYRLTLAGGRPVRSAYYITLSPAGGVPMLVRERP